MPGVDPSLAAGALPQGAGGRGSGGTQNYISGQSGPHYGLPHVGTNIGLPGPPHIPLGGPAGLRHYSIHNHTATHIPGPTHDVNVLVKQKPGLSYPRPADRVSDHRILTCNRHRIRFTVNCHRLALMVDSVGSSMEHG